MQACIEDLDSMHARDQESPRITPEAFPLLKDDYADIRKALLPVCRFYQGLQFFFLSPAELYNKASLVSMHDKFIKTFSQMLQYLKYPRNVPLASIAIMTFVT